MCMLLLMTYWFLNAERVWQRVSCCCSGIYCRQLLLNSFTSTLKNEKLWHSKMSSRKKNISGFNEVETFKHFVIECTWNNKRKANDLNTSGVGTAYPSGVHGFPAVLIQCEVRRSIFSFLCSV